mgnify:FL=1
MPCCSDCRWGDKHTLRQPICSYAQAMLHRAAFNNEQQDLQETIHTHEDPVYVHMSAEMVHSDPRSHALRDPLAVNLTLRMFHASSIRLLLVQLTFTQ